MVCDKGNSCNQTGSGVVDNISISFKITAPLVYLQHQMIDHLLEI